MKKVDFANIVDPDKVAHHESPHLDLYCLALDFQFSIEIFFEILHKFCCLNFKGLYWDRCAGSNSADLKSDCSVTHSY